ncbi:unnamed protein product [Leptosia nina]|uniref:unspecific monooxygenase n=1 Tax=Leptosia nina TaxID=320188 RepID=A0AAV1IXV3_9NEOP
MVPLLFVLLSSALALLSSFYIKFRYFNHWQKKGVPHPKPIPVFGNYKDYIILNKTISDVVNDICEKFPKEPYIGAFYGTNPTLIVRDPEYVKLVLAKDFYYFNSRENGDYSDSEVLTRNVFFASGDSWKIVRQNLTPFFTSAKIKKMFYLIEECNVALEALMDEVAKLPQVEVRDVMARYTIDCIGTCAFGINTNALSIKEENNPFRDMGRKIFEPSTVRGLKLIGRAIWPDIFYKLGFEAFPKEIPNFFKTLLLNVFDRRQYKYSGRNDFVDLILGFKEKKHITGDSILNLKGEMKKISLEVDDDLLCAQCVVFFAAGFETSATTLSILLYELAKNPDKQKLAVEEVDDYLKKNKKLFYECVSETPYLEACMNETLRLYPVLGVITREVVEDYTLPTGLTINKGSRVHIPVHHIHHDSELFPDPEVFRPERFLGAEKAKIVPFSYFPFGEGPRICIGMRFAKMQAITGLITILKKYEVRFVDDTPMKLDFESRTIVNQPKSPVCLKFVPRIK